MSPDAQRSDSLKAWLLVICTLGFLVLVIGASVTYTALYPPFRAEHIPVMNATGNGLTLTEYRDAANVSYSELCAFLANDTTEMDDYRYPGYTCGDFALRLHDAAEFHGIQNGIVAVTLNTTGYTGLNVINGSLYDNGTVDSDKGHAFNVFNTTDRGLVYVDATGITKAEKNKGHRPYKSIVYFKKGMPLGEIALNQSESLDYAYYEQREGLYSLYVENVSRFLEELDSYNDAAVALNGTLNNTLEAKKLELIDEKQALMQREEAKWIMKKPLGIVDRAGVYW